MNYVCNTVLGTEHIMNKIDKNPYSSKHLYSYLTRTYILVRKRNSGNINRGKRRLFICDVDRDKHHGGKLKIRTRVGMQF